VENNLIVPRVLGDAVELPPLVVMTGAVVGASVGGILGVMLATPVIATGRVILGYLYRKLLDQEPFIGDCSESGTSSSPSKSWFSSPPRPGFGALTSQVSPGDGESFHGNTWDLMPANDTFWHKFATAREELSCRYQNQRIKIMDKILVVVFDSESKAYEGSQALQELQNEGSINLYAKAVIARDADGKLTVKQTGDMGPVGTAVGLLTGSLIGLLGGPVGVAIGVGMGTTGGMLYDLAQLVGEII
jgi:uncharacterized membrane protein